MTLSITFVNMNVCLVHPSIQTNILVYLGRLVNRGSPSESSRAKPHTQFSGTPRPTKKEQVLASLHDARRGTTHTKMERRTRVCHPLYALSKPLVPLTHQGEGMASRVAAPKSVSRPRWCPTACQIWNRSREPHVDLDGYLCDAVGRRDRPHKIRQTSLPGPSSLSLVKPRGRTTVLATAIGEVLRDLGPGTLLWEFLLYKEKKLCFVGRKGRRSRADHLVPRSR